MCDLCQTVQISYRDGLKAVKSDDAELIVGIYIP
jgi:hypothetical protein